MPLLFLISGAGTFYALGKRSTGKYLGERFKRLIIPLLAGVFILVPVQVYVERSGQYDSLLAYYPHMFEGIYPEGNFSWHHLWFIAYLFVISLMISPMLRFFKSRMYQKLIRHLEKFFSKPLTLNIFILPLILSQLLLRPYFPEFTNGLFNDWAAVAYYMTFFLAGFILLSNKSISESIRKQRRLFLFESVVLTAMMFTIPHMMNSERLGNLAWDGLSICVAWSCGITAIGYAKQYLNKNNRIRKPANEAIYPFYLLHQPVIVVIANYITKWDISVGWKALLITVISFCMVIVMYRLLIYPFNFMRVIFGMKAIPKEQKSGIRLLPELPKIISAGSSYSTLRLLPGKLRVRS
jgi:peptidoglycan/LPS O-acetylase OafA/YrhL